VPISHEAPINKADSIDSYQQQLSQMGIESDLANEHTIIIRSLPIAIPHLDLKQFLTAIFAKPLPATSELFDLAINCQSFDALHASKEEIEVLTNYIGALPDEQLKQWYKHLSLATCRDLLNA
jgi:DNA mismatch repair protein MutL